MQITAIGAVVIGLAGLGLFSARASAALLGATIPLVAAAAAVLGFGGGASLLCVAVAAAAFVAREGALAARRGLSGARLAPAALFLIGFVAVAIAGAYALPRLFAGETLVFALDRQVEGVTAGVMRFPLTPLAPSSGNVTQSAYLAASAALFLAVGAAARRDPGVVPAMLWAASLSQAATGLADLGGAGWLEHLRTATYQIAPQQVFAGQRRLIGAATEPSVFGAVGAALAVWHLWSFRASGRLTHGLAGAAQAALAALSLSSTALAVLGGAGALFLAGALTAERRLGALALACFGAAGCVALAGWAAFGPHGETLRAAADALFLDKWETESGRERAAWARQALTNFAETGGFGAGLGAARANGWGAAVLGQTGVPGALMAAGFLWFALRAPGPCRAAAVAALGAAALSATRVDPGFLFFALAGAAGAQPEEARWRVSSSTASS